MDSMRARLRRPSRPSHTGARFCWMAWRKSSRTAWWPRKSLTVALEALWFSSRAADSIAAAEGFRGLDLCERGSSEMNGRSSAVGFARGEGQPEAEGGWCEVGE